MPELVPQPGEVEALLQANGLDYRVTKGGREIGFSCPNGCDDDRRPGEEYHCNINSETGLFHCFKCSLKGNFYQFRKDILGEAISRERSTISEKRGRPATKPATIVENAQKALDDEHKQYFLRRGITEASIQKCRLGFYEDHTGGKWYTIPIYKNGELIDVKLRNATDDQRPKYKHLCAGASVEVYGREELASSTSDGILICGGEFDKIIADQMDFGMPTITSTGGEPTFKDEWISDLLTRFRNIYICFDNDNTGAEAMTRLADKIIQHCPDASVFTITLPDTLGEHGDITDAFLKEYTAKQLLDLAKFVGGSEPIDMSKFTEMRIDDIAKVLDLTIKNDYSTKVTTFLAMLTAYTDDDQLNISFNGRSSSGKTYITLQVAELFPENDIKTYGKTSPTSFYYGDNGDIVNIDDNGARVIDLSRRILIFMDQLDSQLQANLRPLLSHDSKKVQFRLTNKNAKGQNAAENGYILGFPATVFCSASVILDEQEQTRFLLLSPDTSAEKIDASLDLIEKRNFNHSVFQDEIASNPRRKLLKDRILYIRGLHVKYIDIPEALHLKDAFIASTSINGKNYRHPRDSRSFTMLASLVKAMALLNAPFRRCENEVITATSLDLEEALRLWRPLQISQHYGIVQQVWDFYVDIVVKLFLDKKRPITLSEINTFYYAQYNEFLGGDMLRKNYIPALSTAGLINMEKGAGGDGRIQYITPTVLPSDQKMDRVGVNVQGERSISFGVSEFNDGEVNKCTLDADVAITNDAHELTQLDVTVEEELRENVKDTRKEDYIM